MCETSPDLTGGGAGLTDTEWRAFQRIPCQGYIHRGWLDRVIEQRMAKAWNEGFAASGRVLIALVADDVWESRVRPANPYAPECGE